MSAILGRMNAGWYALLLSFPLTWYLQRSTSVLYGYREGATAQLSVGIFATLIVIAVFAAWEGGRLASGSSDLLSAARSPLAVLSASIMPAVVSGTLGHFVATVISLSRMDGTPPLPAFRLYLGFVCVAIGLAVLAWLLGHALDVVLSVPLVACIVYLAAIAPSLTRAFQFRALLAEHSTCCSIAQQVDGWAVLTPVVFGSGLALFGAAIAMWVWRPMRWSSLLTALAALVLAAGLAMPAFISDPDQVQARDVSALICQQSASTRTYCVWPEQRADLDAFIRDGDATLNAWATLGLPFAPTTVKTASTPNGESAVVAVAFRPDPSPGDIALAIATAVLPEPYTCQGEAVASYFTMVVWLALAGGVSSDDRALTQFSGRGSAGGGPLGAAQDVIARSPEDQRSWFEQEYGQLQASCP